MAKSIIFVRDNQTLKFLSQQNDWTSSFAEAQVFESTQEACDYCLKHSIDKAEIVLRMGDIRYANTSDV